MEKRALRILFITIIALLGLPMLLGLLGRKEIVKPLKGVTLTQSIPSFNIDNWRNMKFQLGTTKYINQNFCFRPSLIRLYNQFEFSVFNQVSNKNIIKGKDNFLFEKWFINAYYGNDFVGMEKVEREVKKMVAIDSVLKSKGVQFIMALAPGKASVYPEKIPDYLREDTTQNTNYKAYKSRLHNSGITVFDINDWFIQMKPEFNRNLFTKGGTHWSYDAAIIVMDSLLSLVEEKTGKRRNKIQFDSIVKTTVPRSSDDDLLRISNLLFEKLDTDYYYPEYHFEEKYPKEGKLITISDSFFWILYDAGLKNSFEKVSYWYYFNTVYPESFKKTLIVNNIDIQKELLKSDVVILMLTTSSLEKFGWGFINQAYDFLVNNIDKKTAIKRIIASIKNDPKWFASVKKKAFERNIELDSMLRMDAEYVYKHR
jgi:hypothetical protein